jgi:hypothetical protein
MQFMIMAYEDEEAFASRSDERAEQYYGAWNAYVQAISESGIVVSGAGLQAPATATTVQLRGGERQVQDGPYADSKEQLGGFFVVDVPDLDEALRWAARCPAAEYATVEVRPVMPMPG